MSSYPPITPHLAITDVAAAIDFYADAFGAKERLRLTMPDGTITHAEMTLNDALITLGAAIPEYQLEAPDPDRGVQVALTVFGVDVDEAFRRAVAAGATPMSEPADQFHGDRTAAVRCPFGHKWIFAQQLEELTQQEQQRRLDELMSASG